MPLFRRIIFTVVCLLFSLLLVAKDGEHVRLTNLPHVYINTFTGNSITSKTEYVFARMWYVDERDSVAFYDSLEIRGRGNSTWSMQKKPYKLKFHEKVKLLGKGRPNTKKWTLLANHGDKTLIRNALTSKVGERLGMKFNPAAKFVDFTLNGDYVGNYQISDNIDVRPHRVDIEEQDVPLTEESNLTGGYLLEADGFADFQNGRTGFYTPRNAPIRIHYPDEDDIDNRQYRYIREAVNDLENRLFSSKFSDSIEGYRPRVDSTTLANWYVATETSGNPDGFYSTYFYKERDDDRFYWGPLWDYDIAYGNDNRIGDTSLQLMKDVGFGSAVIRSWAIRLWEDPWFARLINRRYREAVADGLQDYMLQQIDSLVTLLQQSQQLNYERWGINVRTLRERVLYSTYDQYVSDLRTYVNRHIPYLQEAFAKLLPEDPDDPDDPKPLVPDFPADTLVYYAIANLGSGTVIDLDTSSDNVCANARDEESLSQQWRIFPLSSGYMFIVNRLTGQALNDPTQGEVTATTNTGTRLNVASADSLDTRQQWNLVQRGETDFNLINRYTSHGANLSGGNATNGASIISYTSDERDSSSRNRIWRITKAADVEDIEDAISSPVTDYALAYDPDGQRLRFRGEDPSAFTFLARVYDSAGRLVRTFPGAEDCHLHGLPRGLYLVVWRTADRTHSVKFLK